MVDGVLGGVAPSLGVVLDSGVVSCNVDNLITIPRLTAVDTMIKTSNERYRKISSTVITSNLR